jgi:signal transduction histidine kinase
MTTTDKVKAPLGSLLPLFTPEMQLAMASHELRAPVSAIVGLMDLVNKTLDSAGLAVLLDVTPDVPARLRFEVRDTGMGIAEQQLARLFPPFTQADASIARALGGSGLGVSICKQIIERMQGDTAAAALADLHQLLALQPATEQPAPVTNEALSDDSQDTSVSPVAP